MNNPESRHFYMIPWVIAWMTVPHRSSCTKWNPNVLNTFEAILSSTKVELNEFIKNTYITNSAETAITYILILARIAFALQSNLFELNNREPC